MKTQRGYGQHPAVRIEHNAVKLLEQLLHRLGLDPSGRARLGSPERPGEVIGLAEISKLRTI